MTLLKQYLQQCKRAAQLCSKQPIDVILVIWPDLMVLNILALLVAQLVVRFMIYGPKMVLSYKN